jgi:hypothetical protein
MPIALISALQPLAAFLHEGNEITPWVSLGLGRMALSVWRFLGSRREGNESRAVPPHPGPLPRGEGATVPVALTFQALWLAPASSDLSGRTFNQPCPRGWELTKLLGRQGEIVSKSPLLSEGRVTRAQVFPKDFVDQGLAELAPPKVLRPSQVVRAPDRQFE